VVDKDVDGGVDVPGEDVDGGVDVPDVDHIWVRFIFGPWLSVPGVAFATGVGW
jgi:hypothetical protein